LYAKTEKIKSTKYKVIFVITFDNELNKTGLKNDIFSNTGNENNCLVVKAAKKTTELIITIQISLAIVSN
jgi:hypothetical protein